MISRREAIEVIMASGAGLTLTGLAEAQTSPQTPPATIKAFAERGGNVTPMASKAKASPGQTSGLVPAGDVRLTVTG